MNLDLIDDLTVVQPCHSPDGAITSMEQVVQDDGTYKMEPVVTGHINPDTRQIPPNLARWKYQILNNAQYDSLSAYQELWSILH